MNKGLIFLTVMLVIVLSGCKKKSAPDPNSLVEVDMYHVVQMTTIGDTIKNVHVPSIRISWIQTNLSKQKIVYKDSMGNEQRLSGGILNLSQYKIKVKASSVTE